MEYKSKLKLEEVPDGSLTDRILSEKPKTYEELFIYRHELLTSEETKEAMKLVDNYVASYQDKDDESIFDEMILAEKYWRGDFDTPTDYDDPASNTNIINTNVETQVASMVDQAIDVDIKAFEPTDLPYIDKARMILDRIKKFNKLNKKIEDWERKKCKFGTSIFRVMYNPNLIDKIGCPEIKVVNPAHFFVDPNIKDIDDLEEAEFIIETIPKSIYWAEQKFGKERAYAIAPGYNPMENGPVFNKETQGNFDINGDHYLHILYWTKVHRNGKTRLRLIQLSGCGIILNDTETDNDFNYFTDDGRYPYAVTVDMRREGMIWGKSNCSLLFSIQDEIDDYTDQIRRNARLTGNPIKLVSTTTGIEIDKFDNTAGQNIPTNDINGVKYLAPPSMPQYLIDRRAQAMSERVIISRISDQQAGIRQAGVSTATESLNLAQSANVATDSKKMMLQDALNFCFEYAFELALKYWKVGMFFTNKDGAFDYFTPSDLLKIPLMKPATLEYQNRFREINPDGDIPMFMIIDGQYRKVKFLFDIQVGAGLPTNKAMAYNNILEAYKAGIISKKTCLELMVEYVKLPVNPDDNKLTKLEEAQIDYQMAQLQSQTAQLMNPMPEGGNIEAPINARETAVTNPRPNTLGNLQEERNLV